MQAIRPRWCESPLRARLGSPRRLAAPQPRGPGRVAGDKAGLRGDVVGPLGDGVRSLMVRKISAEAMAGAVVVVEPDLPQRIARQRIELRAGRADRKAGGRERNMAFQHAGEA